MNKDYSEDASHAVFVYGTLKESYSNHYLMAGSLKFDEACTEASFNMVNMGYPYTFRNGSHRVRGELWIVNGPVFNKLDRLEGHPNHFRRVEEWVYCLNHGKKVKAWMYQNPRHEEFEEYSHYKVEANESGELVWFPKY